MILLLFKLHVISYVTNILFYSVIHAFTTSTPITPTDTENYLPSDDQNITNLMVSHHY